MSVGGQCPNLAAARPEARSACGRHCCEDGPAGTVVPTCLARRLVGIRSPRSSGTYVVTLFEGKPLLVTQFQHRARGERLRHRGDTEDAVGAHLRRRRRVDSHDTEGPRLPAEIEHMPGAFVVLDAAASSRS